MSQYYTSNHSYDYYPSRHTSRDIPSQAVPVEDMYSGSSRRYVREATRDARRNEDVIRRTPHETRLAREQNGRGSERRILGRQSEGREGRHHFAHPRSAEPRHAAYSDCEYPEDDSDTVRGISDQFYKLGLDNSSDHSDNLTDFEEGRSHTARGFCESSSRRENRGRPRNRVQDARRRLTNLHPTRYPSPTPAFRVRTGPRNQNPRSSRPLILPANIALPDLDALTALSGHRPFWQRRFHIPVELDAEYTEVRDLRGTRDLVVRFFNGRGELRAEGVLVGGKDKRNVDVKINEAGDGGIVSVWEWWEDVLRAHRGQHIWGH